MPQVNWDAFVRLPGSAGVNFEMLCRGLIYRHYARFGYFRARANQPGVEFHLRLNKPCQLGDVGLWFGWQCRWYDLPGGKAIGESRRREIVESITLTEKVLPDLTDWVLWTRRTLTKGDQDWFYSLKTRMKLHLWAAIEIEDLLSGAAEILRSTYFGELVLTPETLAKLHAVAVAPIRIRWNPEIHQIIDAERNLRRMLAEPGTWQNVQIFSTQLLAEAEAVDADLDGLPDALAKVVLEVAESAKAAATSLAEAHDAIERGDLDALRQHIMGRPSNVEIKRLAPVPRRLRAYRHRGSAQRNKCARGHPPRARPSRQDRELPEHAIGWRSSQCRMWQDGASGSAYGWYGKQTTWDASPWPRFGGGS